MEKATGKRICLSYLKPMKSANDQRWTKDAHLTLANQYWSVLQDKPEWFAEVIFKKVHAKFDWRPSPAQLQAWYDELMAANEPVAQDAYAACCRMRIAFGTNAKPHPSGKKGLYVEGPPDLPEILNACIETMGGWTYFCSMETPEAIERKHFLDAYTSYLHRMKRKEQAQEVAALMPGELQHALGLDAPATNQKLLDGPSSGGTNA